MKSISSAIALLLTATLATGCSRQPGTADGKSSGPPRPAAVTVTAAAAMQKDVPEQLPAIGTVRAFASVEIKARIDGQLAKIGFKEGDEVQKGALIIGIDARYYEAALREAESVLARDTALLQKAELDKQRTEELANTKAVSATVVDENRARVAALVATLAADAAAVERAKVQLSYCSIYAPISGRVGTVLVDEGNIVKNNETVLAVLNQTRPVYVDFSIPEQYLGKLRECQARGPLLVEAIIPKDGSRSATGQLAVIDNQVDASTGTIRLRAVFPNQDEALWPGQFVNVSATLAIQRGAVVVPANAVQIGQKGPYVYVIKPDQTVESRLVVTGEELGGETVLKEGVQPGETVVTSNHLRLNPGAKVQLKRAEKS